MHHIPDSRWTGSHDFDTLIPTSIIFLLWRCTGISPSSVHPPYPFLSPRPASSSPLRSPTISVQSRYGASYLYHPSHLQHLRFRIEPTDLYFTWQRVYPSSSHTSDTTRQHTSDTNKTFLISFSSPESTYRPVSIPLPSQAKRGERWRLGLTSTSSPTLFELSDDHVGVIGVWSEGIEMLQGVARKVEVARSREEGGKGRANAKGHDTDRKQGRISREWDLPCDGLMRLVEQTSFDLDKV